MRASTPSGALGATIKLLATYLFFHSLVGYGASFPLDKPDLELRQSPNANLLSLRTLQKRSNCVPSNRPLWECDGDVPGVDETNGWMSDWGVAGTVPSVFYTGFPMNLGLARSWAKCYFSEALTPNKPEYGGRKTSPEYPHC